MLDSKPWWQSRGVWGGVVSILAPLVGLTVSDAGELTDLCVMLASVVGGALAMYGRLAATATVTTLDNKKPLAP